MDLKIDSTLPQFQDGLNQFGKSYFDEKYEAERLRGDHSPEAQAKKEKLILEANKIKSDYEHDKCWCCNDYSLYWPEDKRILCKRQVRQREERKLAKRIRKV